MKGYLLFVIIMLFVGIGLSVTAPYLAIYCTEKIGMSPGEFGIFMAISSLSGVFVSSYIAKRSDRGMDRKWIIIYALLASAVGYVAYLIFHDFVILLIVVTVLNGLGAPAIPQMYAYVHESADQIGTEDKTFAMSTLRSLFSLGFLVGPLVGAIILGILGYKGLFLTTVSIYILLAVLATIFLTKRKTDKISNGSGQKSDRSWLKSAYIMGPFIAFISLFAVNFINFTITPLFIVNTLHASPSVVGIVVSLCAGLEIPFMIYLSTLSKKISNHALLMIACGIALIYFVALGFSTQVWQIIVAQLLLAIFVAIVMGNGLSYFTELLPNSPGLATTIYSNGGTLGRLLGSLGGGLIAQVAGYRSVYWVCIVVVIFSFILLIKTKNFTIYRDEADRSD